MSVLQGVGANSLSETLTDAVLHTMTITKIERQKKNVSRLSVFIDGEFSFGISEEDAAFYGLKAGAVLDAHEYDALISELVLKRAKHLALKYLSYSDRTEKEVREKLRQAGEFDENVITRAIDAIKERGYIDDEKYAALYAQSKANRRDGPLKIKLALISRGIDAKTADEAIAALETDDAESAAELLRKRTKGSVPDFAEKKKLYAYLVRKGFSGATINEAFKRINSDIDWND